MELSAPSAPDAEDVAPGDVTFRDSTQAYNQLLTAAGSSTANSDVYANINGDNYYRDEQAGADNYETREIDLSETNSSVSAEHGNTEIDLFNEYCARCSETAARYSIRPRYEDVLLNCLINIRHRLA